MIDSRKTKIGLAILQIWALISGVVPAAQPKTTNPPARSPAIVLTVDDRAVQELGAPSDGTPPAADGVTPPPGPSDLP